ncbi:MAG TPA: protease inhibitor I42 family protein [Pyrinomonadaceae bacterium]|nr:protease inhibitor I42 family protein [Pyrinomonadaceae bacterium]
MKTYDKSTNTIHAKEGDVFSIALASIPGAGYQWDADVDSQKLELVDKEFIPPAGGAIGGAGREVFRFKSLAAGDCEIRFVYKRPWETVSAETHEIKLHVKE